MRVTGNLVEAQIVETFLLSAINHATMVATKGARIVQAAGDAGVMEFGSRRTHPDAAVDAARAAYAVGFTGTSNVEAGMRYGIPVTGTAAHMWTMAHPSEESAFADYVEVFPNAAILLIDTYDTLRGAERAAKIARDKLKGVRLDSGDLDALSRGVRAILDANGCASAKIVASGDLNEYRIAELRAKHAPIDLYGVGTDLVTSLDAPALGGVYKLVELETDGHGGGPQPIAKFSEGKATLPGQHQIFRFRDAHGTITRDVIGMVDDTWASMGEGTPDELLQTVMSGGKRTGGTEPLDVIRARVKRELASLPEELRALDEPTPAWRGLEVALSPRLTALVETVRARFVAAAH